MRLQRTYILFWAFLLSLAFVLNWTCSDIATSEPDLKPSGLPYDRSAHGFPLTNGYWAKRAYGMHQAWDIAIPEGTPVLSIIEGTVYVKANKAAGLLMIIQNDTYRVGFYHLLEPLYVSGAKVRSGEMVAFSGNSGNESRGPHLHYFIEKFDQKLNSWIRVNPNDYVK